MLNQDTRVRICDEVAAKVIDGEAIIINLANGIYYSLDSVGGRIWELLEGGRSLVEVADVIAGSYDVARDKAMTDVERLTGEVLDEKLMQITTDGPVQANTEVDGPSQMLPYEAPSLKIYRDMGDLLALDPPTPGLDNIAWKDPDENSK